MSDWKLPKRPVWFYRDGCQITTQYGRFVAMTTGAADLIWRQWAKVREDD